MHSDHSSSRKTDSSFLGNGTPTLSFPHVHGIFPENLWFPGQDQPIPFIPTQVQAQRVSGALTAPSYLPRQAPAQCTDLWELPA